MDLEGGSLVPLQSFEKFYAGYKPCTSELQIQLIYSLAYLFDVHNIRAKSKRQLRKMLHYYIPINFSLIKVK
jgi:hypothetical protein